MTDLLSAMFKRYEKYCLIYAITGAQILKEVTFAHYTPSPGLQYRKMLIHTISISLSVLKIGIPLRFRIVEIK